MQPEELLIRPVVTEKSARLAQSGQYVFVVHEAADKFAIAAAVEATFKVKVRHVRTIRLPGKRKRRGTRWIHRSGSKRAIVTLAPGQQIDLTVTV